VAILALHISLLVLLAMLAGPDSAYLLTSEPVLLAALTVLLVRAIQDATAFVSRRDSLARIAEGPASR
jgi:hypothetical protein